MGTANCSTAWNAAVISRDIYDPRRAGDNMFQKLSKLLSESRAAQEEAAAAPENGGGILSAGCQPMSNLRYEYTTNLQYKVRSLSARVKAFETGEKYTEMKAGFKKQLAEKDKDIRGLKYELAQANAQAVTVRENWQQVIEDLQKEHGKELRIKDGEIKALEKKLLETQKMLDAEKDKLLEKTRRLYEVETELEEEKGRNRKLKAQISRDHESSSKSSSTIPNRKKITNNREPTGRKPGAQPGHEGHGRKWHEPTNKVEIPAPEEYTDSSLYAPTGRIIKKQLVDIHLQLVVTEYSTPEYRCKRTGLRVHADFPDGMANEVTYAGNVKSLAFLLNNFCNVSVEKTADIISELTHGKLAVSEGMINSLSKEFALKSEAEHNKAFADMLLSPVMCTDFTQATVNGEQMNVLVCAAPTDASLVLYFAKDHKGHAGVKGTPVEDYQWTMVHDHDKTFYNYGSKHQACLEHVRRYLKDSMINEPNLKWNRDMRKLINEMMHFKSSLDPDDERDPDEIDPGTVGNFESRYDMILEQAKEEYEWEPPSKYYPDGYNLYKRLVAYRENHLLFLHDRLVPATNNLAERHLRLFKRKQHQVMAFRSWGGLHYLCCSLGVIASLRATGKNLYESLATVFDATIDRDAGSALVKP